MTETIVRYRLYVDGEWAANALTLAQAERFAELPRNPEGRTIEIRRATITDGITTSEEIVK